MRLVEIAQAMRREVDKRKYGWASRRLSGGLTVVLSHLDGEYILTLRRMKAKPSEAEISTCRRAFGVSAEAVESRRTGNGTQPHAVFVRWKSG